MTDRYTDKPFLRFVDAWVLKAIGHLDEPTEAYCRAMVPQLEQSFGLTGSWERIVEQQMKFTPDLPAQIRKIWIDGKARFAEGNGEAPDPRQFAMIFVDRNFSRA
ncbi:hypothetical protein [Sphingopyxis sp.]|uniref:hypothetical protein n=1 Tax=Sphingopyxis sp. TaxID=1908224 RepID=UPI002ED8AE3F